jgi:hypothetical protein
MKELKVCNTQLNQRIRNAKDEGDRKHQRLF